MYIEEIYLRKLYVETHGSFESNQQRRREITPDRQRLNSQCSEAGSYTHIRSLCTILESLRDVT